ncbi:glycosyltransferase [Pseudomonas sp. GM25]|uniref:glycosyltransferase n=1 Tax=Pseudomonas sp. GM25 TaxID=1144327 RepID=UPI00027014DE|nr:glycosyltransferase [Pseudomonas sp. GM25]EJM31977.1 putative glycosyltransferase [Pseudomonas sp. GM25]
MLKIGNASVAETVRFHVDETAECIIEDDVQLRDNVVIECGAGGYLSIASGTVVNYGTWINGSGKVTIGKDVLIAPNVSITSSTHRYDLRAPIKDQGLRLAPVNIGDDVWIGANASVLAGADIGRGAIIAANSVVKFNVAAESIAAGDPAVRVASRKYKRVVFYTLPLVLRDRPTLFSSIVDVYLPLANKFADEGWECVFVGSDELKAEYPDFRHTWISPATYESDYSQSSRQDWLSDWKCLLNKQPLAFHDCFVASLVEQVEPDLVFCWNYDGSLETACQTRNIPLIFNELGMLRAPNPMAYYSDSRGVNVRSGFSAEFAEYQLQSTALPADAAMARLAQMEALYRFQGASRTPMVLILLQVQDDSNIIMGSPFASMAEYVRHVLAVVEGAPFTVIVKPHPLDEVPDLPEQVQVASKEDSITDLIAAADVVFTLNSSAGFEAALAGKTVYALGKAPYSGTGLTIDVERPQDLAALWQAHGAVAPCSAALRARVLDFAQSRYFLSEAQFNEPSAHLARLARTMSVDPARNGFDPDLESYRQQSYISWLEGKIEEAHGELATINETFFATRDELTNVRDELLLTKDQLSNMNDKFDSVLDDRYLQDNDELVQIQNCLLLEQEQLSLQIESCQSEIEALKQELHHVYASKSWRMTRPVRGVRRWLLAFYWQARHVLMNPRALLRPIYQKLPFLIGVRMRLRSIVNATRARMMRAINSQNNLKAIQTIADRRFGYAPVVPVFEAQPVVDVSIVTYNSGKWVDGFFASLKTQDYPLNKLNLCFVDNGSKDNTVDDLQRWKTQLAAELAGFEIVQGENVGFGLGHDRAIKTGHSEFVLISNIDIVFAPDSISRVVATAHSDTSGAVASWELRQAPYEHPKYYDPVTHETNWSSHACILVRRSAYAKVGGYEHEIFMYGEDVELSYRFRSYGYQLKYCPSAVVYHYTYEHENHVKPIQFTGSTLANAYLRLRYGDFGDKFGALVLQTALLFRPEVYSGARRDLIGNIRKILRKAPHFLSGKGRSKEVSYPFRGFDYEMIRDGAFWTIGEPLAEAPLVTIVTRTYRNRNEFLRQAIMSVLNQTYPNVELVVVEDGGETMKDLVAEFQSPEGRPIRFYGMDKVGRSVTGNYGLEMAKGTYCMFLDDDDLLFSDHVEVLVTALAKNPESVAAYSLAMEVGTNTAADGRYIEVSHETPSYYKHEYDYDILLDHNFIPIQSLLFQRALFLQRGGFETDMSNLEDWNLWLRYGYGNRFTYVAKTTSLFRTPADPNVRLERHKLLHEAYNLAKDRATKSCESYSPLN